MDSPILDMVQQFNSLIRNAIGGPNCIDPKVCDGNCCFIHIDIPRRLIQYYLDNLLATIDQFQRGSTFSFEINVNLKNCRCVFYEKNLNGCTLHSSGMKPPQCWVYPTGLDPSSLKDTCKKAKGWYFINPEDVTKAKEILDKYVFECRKEAEHENLPEIITARLKKTLSQELSQYSPSQIAGIEDQWDGFTVLIGEGMNLGLRPICRKSLCEKDYFECSHVCQTLRNYIIPRLSTQLIEFITKNGFKREYIFMELGL